MEDGSDNFDLCPSQGKVVGYKAVICRRVTDVRSLTCAHCKLLLRNAVQNCDGYRLCECCWDHIKTSSDQVCSKCEVRGDGECYPDRWVRRHINNLVVLCQFKSLGCSWQGNLQDWEAHLEVCEVGVACPNNGCKELVAQGEVEKHLSECCHRLVVCKYCNFQLPFNQKEGHESFCERSLSSFSAPENSHRFPGSLLCQDMVKGRYLNSSTEVPLQQKGNTCSEGMTSTTLPYSSSYRDQQVSFVQPSHVNPLMEELPFETSAMGLFSSFVGTSPPRMQKEIELLQKSLENLKVHHSKKMKLLEKHLKELAGSFQAFSDTSLQCIKSLQADKEKLQDKVRAHNEKNEQLRKELLKVVKRESKEKPTEEAATSPNASSSSSSSVPQTKSGVNSGLEADLRLQVTSVESYNGTLIWKIPEITRHAQDAIKKRLISFFSPPFYTGSHGYKMCIRMYLNGDGTGYETHLSFFFVIMKGGYDSFLKWPFQNKVSLTLINQNHGKNIARSFKPPTDSNSFQRPETDMNIASGFPQFAKLCVLEDPSYIKDDAMYIKCVVDTTEIFHP